MTLTVRQHFEARAADLSGCATLEVQQIKSLGDLLSITPHNEDSLGVYLIDFGNGQYQVDFDHEYGVPDEDARTSDDVDAFLTPAVEGRVRMLIGPSRASIQVRTGAGFERFGTSGIGFRSLIPVPGWRRRARVVDFPAYRASATDDHADG